MLSGLGTVELGTLLTITVYYVELVQLCLTQSGQNRVLSRVSTVVLETF
jgi:hypothetical protein